MTVCAEVSGAKSPHRLARRGEARLDVIVMILVIVAVLGMGTWAFFAYSAWADDEPVVARIENAPVALGAEYRSLLSAAEASTAPLGLTDDRAINDLIIRFVGDSNAKPAIPAERPAYFNVTSPTANSDALDRNSGLSVDDNGRLVGAERVVDPYAGTDVQTLIGLLDAQQRRVNTLIAVISTWSDAQSAESRKAKAALDKYVARAKKFIEEDSAPFLNTMDGKLQDAFREYAAAVSSEAEEFARTNETLNTAEATISGARGQLAEQRVKVGPAAEKAREAMELAGNQISRRSEKLEQLKDFAGFVEQVDPKSGYVYISLGQKDNVRREMSFQVFTPTPDGTATIQIADVRIKAVLGDHLSQCRIDFLKDENQLPKVGDYIKNPNYAPNVYTNYAFVGNFGGSNSKYTKQQLTEMLAEVGINVTAPSASTEVLIIGKGFENDPAFQKLKQDGVVFASMTERDILYMLGVSRPD